MPAPTSGPRHADTLVVHARVLTLDDDHRRLDDGAVAIQGSEIVDVGPSRRLMARWRGPATEVVEAGGRLAMPGLVNAHTHMADSLFRGLIDDLPLEPWLARLWVVERRFLRPETVTIGSRLAMAEMVRGGITTALDMFWFPEATVEVAQEVGFRLLTGPIFFDGDAPDGLDADQRVDRGRELLAHVRDDPLIHGCVLPHATYTVSPKRMAEVGHLGAEADALFSTHVSETAAEVTTVEQRHGHRPPTLLDELGLLRRPAILAHAVHLEDAEIDLLASRPSAVAHCPLSNLKLGSGIARVPDLVRAGVPITLGTDGPVSSNDLDLWSVLRLAAVLHKGVAQDPSLLSARQVVRWATRDAAEALGLGERIGRLAPGYDADLILVDLDRPHLVPRYDDDSHLVYAVGRDDVAATMVRGRWLMRDRRLLTIDEQAAMEAVAALAHDIARAAAS